MVDITQIPQASGIDYTNEAEICGYQLLLCKMFEYAGGFEFPRRTNVTIREVQKQGMEWLKQVKKIIDEILEPSNSTGLTLGTIPQLLDAYDFFYRVCYGTPTFDYIREVRLKTVDRWVKGDKSISQTDMALGILREVRRDVRTLEDRYAEFALSDMEQWIDELNRYGKFLNIPLAEAYNRLAYLLNDDLLAYFGSKEQREIKTQWAKVYVVDDISALDTSTLYAYIPFLRTASLLGFIPCEYPDKEYEYLLSELASRHDRHSFYRKAIEIDIENRRELQKRWRVA